MSLEQGAYVYRLNGEPTRVKETWVRQRQDDGDWRIESERYAPGVHLAVSARGSGRLVRDFAVTWAGEGVGKFAVDCRPKDGVLAVIRWQDSRANRLAPITGSPLLSPLMRPAAIYIHRLKASRHEPARSRWFEKVLLENCQIGHIDDPISIQVRICISAEKSRLEVCKV